MAPRLVPRLLALVQNPNANPEDIIELIRMDPTVSAALLAACHSPAYNRGEKILSIDDAIRWLGFLDAYRMTVLIAFRKGYSDHFFAYEDTPDQHWRRNILTGYYMEEFADEIGANRATYYSCGLLHSIGQFYIDWHCEDRGLPKIPIRDRLVRLERERELTGFTHTELTAMIMDFWNFPDYLARTIRFCDAAEAERVEVPSATSLALAIRLASASPTELLALRNAPAGSPNLLTTPRGAPLGPVIDRVKKLFATAEQFLAV